MSYVCVTFTVNPPEPGSEILAAVLSEDHFESFVFNDTGFEAFIPHDKYNDLLINDLKKSMPNIDFTFTTHEIERQNWNRDWEKHFDPVLIENLAQIRASFHPAPAPPLLDVVIEPKMSFGTGHHPTTWLMAKALFGLNLTNKSLLDVGCGTGILSIIAKKLGARHIIGVDIDEWCIENSRENRKANGYSKDLIDFYQGTINSIEKDTFDFLLANINKNILLREMARYASHLNPGGKLLLSGFFDTDCDELITEAKKCGLKFVSKETRNEWAMLVFSLES